MTTVDRDGDCIDFIEQMGLGSFVRRYTLNEAMHIHARLTMLLYPPPTLELVGPDEEAA